MFKFNFNYSSNETEETLNADESAQEELQWISPQVLNIEYDNMDFTKWSEADVLKESLSDVKIKYLNPRTIVSMLNNESQPIENSDLVPSIYEGGFKIWECTWDVLKYLQSNLLDFSNKRVLDLGCGAGLLGIYSLHKGAQVVFQDYNDKVLRQVTVPNVMINSCVEFIETEEETNVKVNKNKLENLKKRVAFYFGDWAGFADLLFTQNDDSGGNSEESKFDVILSSETIYSVNCHSKLLNTMKTCLKQNGIVIMGAKCHYFGVGGGTFEFINLIKEDAVMDVNSQVVWKEGINREILTLKHR